MSRLSAAHRLRALERLAAERGEIVVVDGQPATRIAFYRTPAERDAARREILPDQVLFECPDNGRGPANFDGGLR